MALMEEIFFTEDLQNGERKINSDLLKLLFEFRDYSIVMLDATGHITSWNEGAEYMYNYTAGEIIGKHESILYTQADVQNGLQQTCLDQAKKRGRYWFETLKRKKKGRSFTQIRLLIPLTIPTIL